MSDERADDAPDVVSDFDAEAWAEELEAKREEKDEFLAEHPQSPLPPEEREGFDGLDYFEPDPSYRVAADVEVHDQPEPVEMETTGGTPVRYLRIVTFSANLGGERVEFHGYRQERDDSQGVFVPFRDKTTGQQSYEQGRYMELEPERDLSEADAVPVDFDLAYTPFCAYSDAFSCPLPPEENWLDVAIEAGERAP